MDNQVNIVARGETYYNGGTIDSNDLQGTHLEGLTKVFKNTDPSNRKVLRNERDVRCVLVRNSTTITLHKGDVVTWQTGQFGKRVAGKCRVTAEQVAGVVDDHIGSSGVPANDLFWLIVKGDALCRTPATGAEFTADIAEFDLLYALTAANSTSAGSTSTEGRFTNWGGTFSAAQTTDGTGGKIIKNSFARALSAKTTHNTKADILVHVDVSF
jgi:hypothetical protein